jgi:hypothetical protein
MTTMVTVKCHGYPVLVEKIECPYNNSSSNVVELARVAPGQVKEFTLCSDMQFRITELPTEVKV